MGAKQPEPPPPGTKPEPPFSPPPPSLRTSEVMRIELVNAQVCRMNLQPGDRVLVRVSSMLTKEHRQAITDQLRTAWGDDIRFVIADPTFDFSIISSEQR
jgi:hypothetical protein